MSIKSKEKALHFYFRIPVALLSLVLVFSTAIPLLRSNVWWIRIFDFPRIQIALLIVLTLANYTALHLFKRLQPWEYVLAHPTGGAGLLHQL
ncbi:hypothetical protein [Rhodohalobacter sp.]|uniref:hypothetical protein n=1 Tax=Rhodohalobacter sp. TaxID=1974210 RepID=UPI0035651642